MSVIFMHQHSHRSHTSHLSSFGVQRSLASCTSLHRAFQPCCRERRTLCPFSQHQVCVSSTKALPRCPTSLFFRLSNAASKQSSQHGPEAGTQPSLFIADLVQSLDGTAVSDSSQITCDDSTRQPKCRPSSRHQVQNMVDRTWETVCWEGSGCVVCRMSRWDMTILLVLARTMVGSTSWLQTDLGVAEKCNSWLFIFFSFYLYNTTTVIMTK